MKKADNAFLSEIDRKASEMKEKILGSKDEITFSGKAHYVAEDGDDANDGLSPETAWRTPARVSSAELSVGDAVLFKRGDIFRGQVITAPGVTYAAYGEGDKPKIYGYEVNLADEGKWLLVNSAKNIWKYTDKTLDAGTLVFNDGEYHSIKLIPSYSREGKYVLRDEPDKDFVLDEQMVRDLDIFCDVRQEMSKPNPEIPELFPVPVINPNMYGDLYLRCDKGNPGKVFKSIELLPKRNTFAIKNNENVRIDNLCIKYCGAHGIGGGSCKGLHVTNCEIGWIGGSVQHYNGSNPKRCGIVTRYGNGVEIYGWCEDYVVDSCYIYEVYDAGVTQQTTASGVRDVKMYDVRYTNNLIERCVYNIEYFPSETKGTKSLMKNFEISGNILRYAGYGWGRQRYNPDTPAHIKSWDSANPAENYNIHDNIFDRSTYRMLHIAFADADSAPNLYGNTYIQEKGAKLGTFGVVGEGAKVYHVYDENAEKVITEEFGEKNGNIYYI